MINFKETNGETPKEVNKIKFNGQNVNIVREEYIDDNGQKKYRNLWAKPLGGLNVKYQESTLTYDCNIWRISSKEPSLTIKTGGEKLNTIPGSDNRSNVYYGDQLEIRGGIVKGEKDKYITPVEGNSIWDNNVTVSFYKPLYFYDIYKETLPSLQEVGSVKIINKGDCPLVLKNLQVELKDSHATIHPLGNFELSSGDIFYTQYLNPWEDIGEKAIFSGEIQPYLGAVQLDPDTDYGGCNFFITEGETTKPSGEIKDPIIAFKAAIYQEDASNNYIIAIDYLIYDTEYSPFYFVISRYEGESNDISSWYDDYNENLAINKTFESSLTLEEIPEAVMLIRDDHGRTIKHILSCVSKGDYTSAPLQNYDKKAFGYDE